MHFQNFIDIALKKYMTTPPSPKKKLTVTPVTFNKIVIALNQYLSDENIEQ